MSASTNLWAMLERAEQLWPDRIGAVDGGTCATWREIGARTRALASGLRALGVARGERVAILADNSLPFLEAYFAAAGLGAILCPLNTRLAPVELAAIARDCGARLLIAGESHAGLAAALRAEAGPLERALWLGARPTSAPESDVEHAALLAARPAAFAAEPVHGDDVAQLYYTSGTTGAPKGVMLTHRNVAVHALATIAELGLSDADVWGHVAPMFHLADAWATFAITWVGGRHVFVPRFDERAVLDAFERERVTISNLVPTMLNRLVHTEGAGERRFPALRRILSGGAPIAPALVRRIMDVFRCEYVQTYGMTETSPYLTLSLLKEHLKALPAEAQFAYRAKTGRAFVAVELDVVGEDGASVPRDGRAIGEIRVRGATVTPGYWNRPEETRAAFRDGWLCTGDLATIDAEGYVDIVDRKKDMIITGGEKVYSTQVEHVLCAHPAVLDAAVFGVPDPLWGEAVRAAIVLRPGSSAGAEELTAFCRERLAGFETPRTLVFLAELPRTGSGKVSKLTLRRDAR